jgi:hypothetical protein
LYVENWSSLGQILGAQGIHEPCFQGKVELFLLDFRINGGATLSGASSPVDRQNDMVEVATKGISPLSGACDAKQLKLHIQVLLFYSFCTHTQPMQRSASMGQWSFFATMITFLPVRISCGV